MVKVGPAFTTLFPSERTSLGTPSVVKIGPVFTTPRISHRLPSSVSIGCRERGPSRRASSAFRASSGLRSNRPRKFSSRLFASPLHAPGLEAQHGRDRCDGFEPTADVHREQRGLDLPGRAPGPLLASRCRLGHGTTNDTALALAALHAAVGTRHAVPTGLVHHTAHGGPYASDDYRGALTTAAHSTSTACSRA